ncbi:MAG: hypothetical protein FJY92_08725, partial [Candidatus Hydrogenedentes bacterium]|nr:hypothetical protein [Candidatus Hydrogenedentota bacterium]
MPHTATMQAKQDGAADNRILIGIDAGTSVFKAAAFDARTGRVLALATRRMPIMSPQPGWIETPAVALDRALGSTLNSLRNSLGARWRRVCGVGIAAQGGSTIFVNRETGDARADMVLWNDTRAFQETIAIRKRKLDRWWRERLLNDWTPAGLGRFAWFARHQRAVFNNQDLIHVGAGEYVFHRMTGVWRQDAGNAIQIGSYDAAKGALTNDMLRLVNFSTARVAPLRNGHETAPLDATAALAFRLEPNIPVAGPYIDQEAALQSVHCVAARPLQCSLGTAWVGNFSLRRSLVGSASMQFVLRGADAHTRTIVLPLLTGNTAWDWALSRFLGGNQREALAKADALMTERGLPPNGMVCIPWLLQGDPIDVQTSGACTFYGVGPTTTAHDFVRAVACGLCFELLRVFEPLKQRKHIDSVIISGGASKAKGFRALIATLFAPLPVYVQ